MGQSETDSDEETQGVMWAEIMLMSQGGDEDGDRLTESTWNSGASKILFWPVPKL